jgi:hypothetical protein
MATIGHGWPQRPPATPWVAPEDGATSTAQRHQSRGNADGALTALMFPRAYVLDPLRSLRH